MKYVGTSVKRVDGIKKATGSLKYVDDINIPKLLHAAVLRSPYAHAKIVSIDTSEAEKLQGVKAVATGDDVKKRSGLYLEDKNFLAKDTVKFIGEAVVAVAATTREIAEEALALIKVEYEELPGVYDGLEAMKEDAPIIHPDLMEYNCAPVFFPKAGTNISNHYKLRKGDVEKGFAEADHVVENTFYVPHVQHCPIEPHVAMAKEDPDGQLTVWCSSQSPYAVRAALAVAFEKPLNKVRVLSPAVGGGFGAKAGTTLEGVVIALAQKCVGYSVRLTYSREEEMMCSFVRQGLHLKIKTGINNDGNIVAVKNEFVWDGGAYTEYGVNIAKASGYASTGPYDIPNVWTDSYCVYTNNPVGGPYRGFGMCEIHFGIEQNLDILAEKIGITGKKIREINCHKVGGRTATNAPIDQANMLECIQQAAEAIEYDRKRTSDDPNIAIGVGLACGHKAPSMPANAQSSAIIKLNEDGTAGLLVSAQDIGQGSDTVMVQIASEVLSIDPSKISIRTGDTEHTPYEWQTVASRITYCAGRAVMAACEDARDQLFEMAQIKLGIYKRDLELRDGYIVSKIYPDRKVSIAELSLGLNMPDGSGLFGPVIGRGTFIPPNIRDADKKTGLGDKPVTFWTYGCNGAEVEVNKETGHVKVRKMVSSFDVGRVINPQLIEGQFEGALVQAMGTALWEDMLMEEGVCKAPNFVDYKIPTSDDIPEMELLFIEDPEETGPYGARGVAEPAMVPGAPAIASALYDALGVRIPRMPFTPERVLKAIKEKEGKTL